MNFLSFKFFLKFVNLKIAQRKNNDAIMDDDEDAGSTTTNNNYEYEVVNLSIAHNVDLVAPISRHNSIQLREIMAVISEFREVMMQRVDGNKVSLKFLSLLLLLMFFFLHV